MGPAHPLRTLSVEEERALQRTVKATSEPVYVVKRARVLLAVKADQAYSKAAQEVGYKSGDSVSQLVERFNKWGLAALQIAAGRGRKETYTCEQRTRILAEVQRAPDREKDGTATWSLNTSERALRKEALPQIRAKTIREVLYEAGYIFGKTRTWCPMGTALRVRKAGKVKVEDTKAQEKKP
jgi:hypothetical protein